MDTQAHNRGALKVPTNPAPLGGRASPRMSMCIMINCLYDYDDYHQYYDFHYYHY